MSRRKRIAQLVAACDFAAIGGQLVLVNGLVRYARDNMREAADMLSMADYPFKFQSGAYFIQIGSGRIIFRGVQADPQLTLCGSRAIAHWAADDPSLNAVSFRDERRWMEVAKFQADRYRVEFLVWNMLLQHHQGDTT